MQWKTEARGGVAARNEAQFERFVAERQRDLQRISRHTRSEYSLTEVINEAWIEAATLQRKGHRIDLACQPSQDLLISHLYQRLVRYTDLKVRYGMRLDHAAPGDAEGASHWLLRTRKNGCRLSARNGRIEDDIRSGLSAALAQGPL